MIQKSNRRKTATKDYFVAVFLYPFVYFLLVIAFITSGCRPKTETGENIDFSKVPRQVGDNIFANQTTNGSITMRMEAPRMEKYETDSLSYDLFPNGFDVYSYDDGNLETQIHAKVAKHTTWRDQREQWAVYGDVEITNYIKGEKMFTDTLYWDRYEHKIYTDCFVKMSSPQGYMQGYGMSSDEMARNAIILRPFDSYGKVISDTVNIYIDSINFIGPMPKVERAVDLKIVGKEQEREEEHIVSPDTVSVENQNKEIETNENSLDQIPTKRENK